MGCTGAEAIAQLTPEDLASSPPVLLEKVRKVLQWDEPAEPAKLVGPIYFVGTKGLSVYLITTSEGHIVLNSGMPGSGPMIEKSIRQLGFKPEEIKILLTGHAHLDHAGGHAYLQKLSGARIALIREEQELFESGGKRDFHYSPFKEFEFEPAKVETVFEDGDQITLGDVTLSTLLTGGHTQGATTFVTTVVDDGQTYKVAFPSSTSVNPGYRLTKNPSYEGIADDFRRSLHVLETLKPDVWFHQHNENFDYDAKLARAEKAGPQAWVDPEGYRKWIVGQREKFHAALEKERGEGKDSDPE